MQRSGITIKFVGVLILALGMMGLVLKFTEIKESSKELESRNIKRPTWNPDGFVAHEPSDIAPCGEVCKYGGRVVPGQHIPYHWPRLEKQMNCKNIMKRMAYRHHAVTNPAPEYPPDYLLDEFTMFGDMPISRQYHAENWIAKPKSFSHQHLTIINESMWSGRNINMYKDAICVQHTLMRYISSIKGQVGFVVGTDQPWLEGILFGLGAKNITTLEYAEMHFETPGIIAYTPYDFADKWLKGETELYDFGVSFSSIEHSGLGRYTDPLNPYGDMESMAQSWCMVKPGGMFAFGVEDSLDDTNRILFNAHRVYGSRRLAQLTANWEVKEKALCADIYHHNFIILRKPLL